MFHILTTPQLAVPLNPKTRINWTFPSSFALLFATGLASMIWEKGRVCTIIIVDHEMLIICSKRWIENEGVIIFPRISCPMFVSLLISLTSLCQMILLISLLSSALLKEWWRMFKVTCYVARKMVQSFSRRVWLVTGRNTSPQSWTRDLRRK